MVQLVDFPDDRVVLRLASVCHHRPVASVLQGAQTVRYGFDPPGEPGCQPPRKQCGNCRTAKQSAQENRDGSAVEGVGLPIRDRKAEQIRIPDRNGTRYGSAAVGFRIESGKGRLVSRSLRKCGRLGFRSAVEQACSVRAVQLHAHLIPIVALQLFRGHSGRKAGGNQAGFIRQPILQSAALAFPDRKNAGAEHRQHAEKRHKQDPDKNALSHSACFDSKR